MISKSLFKVYPGEICVC